MILEINYKVEMFTWSSAVLQVSDTTSSYSCFCPKFLQQFQNPYYGGGFQFNQQFIPGQLQQLYNQQLQQSRILQQQQAFPTQYQYTQNFNG
jgi:hypothetical protein